MNVGHRRSEGLEQYLYDRVLQTANNFLHNCKHFSIEVLQQKNPTYKDVAKIMKAVSVIIVELGDDIDPMMGQKAGEYVDLMHRMGLAITNGDSGMLSTLVDELDRKPFL